MADRPDRPHHVFMGISLVSAPILGFDIVRHPRGAAVADTLLWSLTLTPADLPAFGSTWLAVDPTLRAQAWERARELGAGHRRSTAVGPRHPDQPARSAADLITTLRRSLLVDLDDLNHLVAHDILAWAVDPEPASGAPRRIGDATAARAIVGDAVAACWVDDLPADMSARLAQPMRTIRRRLEPRAYDVGPFEQSVTAVLERLRGLDAEGRRRLRTVNTAPDSKGPSWAESVHEASWAAFTTGRLRAAAQAQLLAAQAFIAGGLNAADGAEGVWNIVSGHVHACMVADVLPSGTHRTLSRAWRAATWRR